MGLHNACLRHFDQNIQLIFSFIMIFFSKYLKYLACFLRKTFDGELTRYLLYYEHNIFTVRFCQIFYLPTGKLNCIFIIYRSLSIDKERINPSFCENSVL